MRLLPLGGRVRKRPGRGRAALASGALLLGVLASFTGQTGAVAAAQPAATASPQPGPDAGATAAAGPQPVAAPTADPAAAHEAAVRSLQQSGTAGACPAALQPSTVVNCSVEANTTGSFQITLSRPDVVVLQLVSSPGIIRPKLISPGGTAVTCEHVLGAGDYAFGAVRCPAAQAGTYTVKAENGTGSQTQIWVSYLPLLSSTTCKAVAPADRRLGAPTVFQGSLPGGSAGDCYALDLAANDVLRGYTSSKDMLQSVYDATGKQLCVTTHVWPDTESVPLDCKLTGTAPFRVMAVRPDGAGQAYDLTLARLSRPEGCVVVEPLAFGVSPDLSSTVRCRTLRASQSAWHAFGPVASGTAPSGTLFTADGAATARDCASGGCELTAGDHTWAVDPKTPGTSAYGMAFHSAKETRGCTATHDNGLVAGPVTGTFGGPGQKLCLTLPTATGKGVYLLNRTPAAGKSVDAVVYDASGVRQCEYSGYHPVCKLTGTAPFRAVLTGAPSQAYGLAIHRTGEAAGCAAWPQTGFGGSVGVEVPLTADRLQSCLSLPADKHSAAEMLHYSAPLNREWATFYVADAAGNVACAGGAVLTCSLTPGAPYTAMLVGQAADTHKLARRDISGTANCPAPASTKVGGQSTPFDLTSALDARCLRVSGAATDKFWLSARTAGGKDDPSATLQVVDANGKHMCRQYTVSCRVTGSTSYVVLVHATGFQGKPIHTDVDTWKVGTSAGWAQECTANRISVEGFPSRSGVLTESSTAYCAVVDMKPSQSFAVSGQSISNDTGSYATPELSLLSGRKWEGSGSESGYQCDGGFGSRCSAASDAEAGQAVLMLSAGKTVVPVEYTMRGSCVTGCTGQQPTPWVSGISPATGPAGTWNQAVVHGTGLTLGMELMLTPGDTPYGTGPFMRSLSVSPDGTWLKVLVDTTGLTPGQYDVSPVVGHRLPKAYTVTAAATAAKSRFVPITPSRFLDTRDGVGATKARVGPGGVVTLQVAGVKGVPAGGVTAVVMNVTAVYPTEAGHVMVYPNGQPKPSVSNLNFSAGQIVPNLVTVPVVNGKVDLRNNAGSVDLIADVTGYYTDKADTGSALTPITPARFLDTRDGVGATKARVGPGGVVTLQVAGVKGVPTSGVTAVVMNVTAVNPTEAGHVTVYPNGQAAPGVSNLNFTAGQIVPNLVTVPVVNGKVDLRNNSGSVDLIADVTGYYSANGSTFSAGSPVRLLDTRDGTGARAGAVGQGGIVSLQVAGVEGVPLTGVTAVVLNVTVTNPTQDSHLIVYPHGAPRPGVSNLNYRAGQTVSNLVVVPVVDGRVTFFNNAGSVDVIADLNGYFTS